jgi:protein TonB
MKLLSVVLGFVLITHVTFAQTTDVPAEIPEPQRDSATIALEQKNTTVLIEQAAGFPGGEPSLFKFIGKNLKKPELVELFGYKGRIVMGFNVDKRGAVTDIHAFSNSGIGYEEEFIAVIGKLPFWKPAVQNGRVVDEKFTIPFTINLPLHEISMAALKKSSYKFTFQIKDKSYTVDQAEPILGKVFSPDKIDYVKSFFEQPEENKKNKQYVIQIKD